MNPWVNIPNSPPYVLPEDEIYIDAFNNYSTSHPTKNHSNFLINLQQTPEPRLGPINAPLVILQQNPSCNVVHAPTIAGQVIPNLASVRNEYAPHEGLRSLAPLDTWWRRILAELIEIFPPHQLACEVCSIEYFPYRSTNFTHSRMRLPSQAYTFDLVRHALKRQAIIVITAMDSSWIQAVPELYLRSTSQYVFSTKSPRNKSISRRNLPDGVFDQIVQKIRNSIKNKPNNNAPPCP